MVRSLHNNLKGPVKNDIQRVFFQEFSVFWDLTLPSTGLVLVLSCSDMSIRTRLQGNREKTEFFQNTMYVQNDIR